MSGYIITYDHIAKGARRSYTLRPIVNASEARSTEANLKLNPDVSNVLVILS